MEQPNIQKLSDGDGREELLERPKSFNLNTATNHLVKRLAKLLSPLSTS